MNKFLFFFLALILALGSTSAFGQTIVRSSLSSLGSSITNDGFTLRQTTGQPSNTFIFSHDEIILRQGFQQPLRLINQPIELLGLKFKLSPNPARDRTLISFEEEVAQYSIVVRNINGIILGRISSETLQNRWLDLTGYLPGIYFLTVLCDDRHGTEKLIVTH